MTLANSLAAEGTIQFAYDLIAPEEPAMEAEGFAELAGWRKMLRRLDLLGQDPQRYGGFGFGNLSRRDPDRADQIAITASQSSGEATLAEDDLVRITGANLGRFWVDAIGHKPPSSETLTHAMVYAADQRLRWVFHVHSPDLWHAAEALNIPATAQDVPYGSAAMVKAVADLLAQNHSRPLVFATLGHEDGIFACGMTARDTGGLLLSYLARAFALQMHSV